MTKSIRFEFSVPVRAIGAKNASGRSPVPFVLSGGHIAAGMTVALFIGIAAGMAPAISAAKMHPAVALNSPEGDF